ncbi:MAG: hypothetical protein WCY19_04435 [Candidatus Gastranaerophilaceae bacterium]
MPTVNQIRDAEVTHQKRKNLTESQKKNADLTKEGFVVNSLIKDPKNLSMNELYDSMVISDDARMPEKLKENKKVKDKSLMPLSLITAGVMGIIAAGSSLVKKSAEVNKDIKPNERIDHLTRNISITKEELQGLYQLVQCPNKKTLLAASGVIVLGAMAFMGKMFTDGFKEIWVKKREADIQKNLQENLIAVETQSFSGKIQIIRSMLADKAREFSDYLSAKPKTPPVFERFNSKLKFLGKKPPSDTEEVNGLKYFAMGILTISSIIGLGYLSLKNLRSGKKFVETFIEKQKGKIGDIVSASSEQTKEADKVKLKIMLKEIDSSTELIEENVSKLNWTNPEEKKAFKDSLICEIRGATTKADPAMAGSGVPKAAFISFVSDYKAFLYNYILDSANPQFKMLFLSTTTLTAATYAGKAAGEAVKDVQVKKINAQTEFELQQRLVATELRNFKAKKDAAIDPLCEEFYTQLQKGKPKTELKTIAENILYEVKNGPPFVYS